MTAGASRPPGALPASLAEIHADQWSAPFWAAAREHRLVCARCASCGTFRMPPSPFCPVCRSQGLEWVDLPGTGTVYTFTVVRHAVLPIVREHVPYVIAVVELDGAPGARLLGNVVGLVPEEISVGLTVRVVWDDTEGGATIPRFEAVA
jgi:uncharacterized OB-fold protein